MQASCPLWLLLLTLVGIPAPGQVVRSVEVVAVMPPPPRQWKAGSQVVIPLTLRIRAGYHINSNTPAEDYLIPTKLTWDPLEPVILKAVEYPEGETVKYDFSEEPLSVYSNKIVVQSTFDVHAPLPAGTKEITGKLRYQACTEKACLPPKTIPVNVPVR